MVIDEIHLILQYLITERFEPPFKDITTRISASVFFMELSEKRPSTKCSARTDFIRATAGNA